MHHNDKQPGDGVIEFLETLVFLITLVLIIYVNVK